MLSPMSEHHAPLAASAGVGLKPLHAANLFDRHGIGFFEVHAENYMGAGGPPHALLRRVRESFPLSVHGVGLSIGGSGPLCKEHLRRLKRLIERYEPALFSEHLAWSSHGGAFLNDLLPIPYNTETLGHICDHIDQVQETLRTRMLLENPSTYIVFENSSMSEPDFLRAVAARTGCGLLLDVSNVYISAINHNFEPMAYIDSFPLERVEEIHLAGFATDSDDDGAPLLIDTHGAAVAEIVWALFRRTIARTGPRPTLIEWDNDVPAFTALAAEAGRAQTVLSAERMRRLRRSCAETNGGARHGPDGRFANQIQPRAA
jgi:uncharacterized protein (UPF0276 family)